MARSSVLAVLVVALAACRQQPDGGAPAAEDVPADAVAENLPDADINASLAEIAAGPVLDGEDETFRFAGRWAADAPACATAAWTIATDSLRTATGAECRFSDVRSVPGGYDIAARCAEGGREREGRIALRYAESAGALLVESAMLGETGLISCPE